MIIINFGQCWGWLLTYIIVEVFSGELYLFNYRNQSYENENCKIPLVNRNPVMSIYNWDQWLILFSILKQGKSINLVVENIKICAQWIGLTKWWCKIVFPS